MADLNNTVRDQYVLEASAKGVDQTVAAAQKLTGATDALASAQVKVGGKVLSVLAPLEQLARRHDALFLKEQRLVQAQATLDKAMERRQANTVAFARASDAVGRSLRQLHDEIVRTGRAAEFNLTLVTPEQILGLKRAASSARESAEAFEEAEREAQRYQTAAEQLAGSLDTARAAQARYTAEVAEYNEMVKRGLLTEQQRAAAIAQTQSKFNAATRADPTMVSVDPAVLTGYEQASRSARESAAAFEEAAQEAARFEAAAASIISTVDTAESAQRQYNEEIARYDDLLARSLITERQRAAAIAQTQARMNAARPSNEALVQSVDPRVILGLESTTRAARESAEAFEEAARASDKLEASARELLQHIDPVGEATKRFNRELWGYAQMLDKGIINQTEFNAAIDYSRGKLDSQTKGVGLAAHQITNLGYQLNDVASGLISGQSPFTIMAQQGPQVYQILNGPQGISGGLASLGRFLLTLVTPATVVMGLLGTIGLTAIAAAVSARNANQEIARVVNGIGKASGASVNDIKSLAMESSSALNVTVGSAREAALAFAATGNVHRDTLAANVATAKAYGRMMGMELPEAAKELAKMLEQPGDSAQQLGRRFGTVDEATANLIATMEAGGDTMGAAAVLMDNIRRQAEASAPPVDRLAKAWSAIKSGVSRGFTSMGEGVVSFFDPTEEERLADVNQQLDALESRRQKWIEMGSSASSQWIKNYDAQIAKLVETKNQLEEVIKSEETRKKNEADAARIRELSFRAREAAENQIPGMGLGRQLEKDIASMVKYRDHLKSLGQETREYDEAIARAETKLKEFTDAGGAAGMAIARMNEDFRQQVDSLNAVTLGEKAAADATKAFTDVIRDNGSEVEALTAKQNAAQLQIESWAADMRKQTQDLKETAAVTRGVTDLVAQGRVRDENASQMIQQEIDLRAKMRDALSLEGEARTNAIAAVNKLRDAYAEANEAQRQMELPGKAEAAAEQFVPGIGKGFDLREKIADMKEYQETLRETTQRMSELGQDTSMQNQFLSDLSEAIRKANEELQEFVDMGGALREVAMNAAEAHLPGIGTGFELTKQVADMEAYASKMEELKQKMAEAGKDTSMFSFLQRDMAEAVTRAKTKLDEYVRAGGALGLQLKHMREDHSLAVQAIRAVTVGQQASAAAAQAYTNALRQTGSATVAAVAAQNAYDAAAQQFIAGVNKQTFELNNNTESVLKVTRAVTDMKLASGQVSTVLQQEADLHRKMADALSLEGAAREEAVSAVHRLRAAYADATRAAGQMEAALGAAKAAEEVELYNRLTQAIRDNGRVRVDVEAAIRAEHELRQKGISLLTQEAQAYIQNAAAAAKAAETYQRAASSAAASGGGGGGSHPFNRSTNSVFNGTASSFAEQHARANEQINAGGGAMIPGVWYPSNKFQDSPEYGPGGLQVGSQGSYHFSGGGAAFDIVHYARVTTDGIKFLQEKEWAERRQSLERQMAAEQQNAADLSNMVSSLESYLSSPRFQAPVMPMMPSIPSAPTMPNMPNRPIMPLAPVRPEAPELVNAILPTFEEILAKVRREAGPAETQGESVDLSDPTAYGAEKNATYFYDPSSRGAFLEQFGIGKEDAMSREEEILQLAREQYDTAMKQYEEQVAQREQQQAAYEHALQEYEVQKEQYEQQVANFDQQVKAYEMQMVQYELQMKAFQKAAASYDEQVKLYNQQMKQYDVDLAAYNKAVEEYAEIQKQGVQLQGILDGILKMGMQGATVQQMLSALQGRVPGSTMQAATQASTTLAGTITSAGTIAQTNMQNRIQQGEANMYNVAPSLPMGFGAPGLTNSADAYLRSLTGGAMMAGFLGGPGRNRATGFAEGGSFEVGGVAGRDANPVLLNLTRGEKGHIEPANSNERGGRPVVVHMTVHAKDARSFKESEAEISGGLVDRIRREIRRG